MFEEVTQKESRFKVFWPSINDLCGAQRVETVLLPAVVRTAAVLEGAAGYGG